MEIKPSLNSLKWNEIVYLQTEWVLFSLVIWSHLSRKPANEGFAQCVEIRMAMLLNVSSAFIIIFY